MEKYYIMETLLRFHQNYCAVVTNKYLALEKEEILNLAILILLGFW